MTNQKKMLMTVPDDIANKLKKLKREFYSDKPHTELYRDLLRLGIKEMEQQCSTSK